MLTALILFFATYLLMIFLPKLRAPIALVSAALFVLLGILPLSEVPSAINWNILLMLAGTMGTVSLFIDSKMPSRMADVLLAHSPNVMWAAVFLSLFAGFVSAFVDNVATVLMIAPVGMALAKKLGLSPVSLLISIAVSSNLQGAATLVGDTTSILLGGYAGMDFLDFFFLDGRFSIFWSVELGALVTIPIIARLFRGERQKIKDLPLTEVSDYFPTFLLVSNVALLILASFFPDKPDWTNGFLCVAVCLVGFLQALLRRRHPAVLKALRDVDCETLLLLAGLFVVIAGITEAGVVDAVSGWFLKLGGNNLLLMYTLIVWGSVLISAFVDNIPYVAAMLPVVSAISAQMGCSPYILFFGLLIGATLGGNITPIGASANIAAIGILRKGGYEVKNRDFFRIGIPFTLSAVLTGYLYCWFVWGH